MGKEKIVLTNEAEPYRTTVLGLYKLESKFFILKEELLKYKSIDGLKEKTELSKKLFLDEIEKFIDSETTYDNQTCCYVIKTFISLPKIESEVMERMRNEFSLMGRELSHSREELYIKSNKIELLKRWSSPILKIFNPVLAEELL